MHFWKRHLTLAKQSCRMMSAPSSMSAGSMPEHPRPTDRAKLAKTKVLEVSLLRKCQSLKTLIWYVADDSVMYVYIYIHISWKCTVQLSIGFRARTCGFSSFHLQSYPSWNQLWIHHVIPRHLLHITGLTKVLDQLVVLEPICNVSIIGQFEALPISCHNMPSLPSRNQMHSNHLFQPFFSLQTGHANNGSEKGHLPNTLSTSDMDRFFLWKIFTVTLYEKTRLRLFHIPSCKVRAKYGIKTDLAPWWTLGKQVLNKKSCQVTLSHTQIKV